MAVYPLDSVGSGWAFLKKEEPPDESISNRGPKQQSVAEGISDRERADPSFDGRFVGGGGRTGCQGADAGKLRDPSTTCRHARHRPP